MNVIDRTSGLNDRQQLPIPALARFSRTIPATLIVILFAQSASSMAQQSLPAGWEADAALRSVHFVDLDFGWAVGDRGTILRTEDGGANWHSITQPRDLMWQDVFFLDGKNGWIAGGFHRASLDRSSGVIIKTTDGGQTWSNVSFDGLPLVRRIRFFDPSNGWLLCQPNSLFPQGVAVTSDGGKSWTRPSRNASQVFLVADCPGPRFQIGISKERKIVTGGRSVENPRVDHPKSIRVSSNGFGLILSAGPTILKSDDGFRWEKAPNFPSVSANWESVSIVGENAWIVGAPGSCIAHTSDRGNTWKLIRTSESTPIYSVFFLTEERGWMVGALGKIMITKDGGKSWVVQRQKEKRLAVLHVAKRPDQVSYEMLSLLCGSFSHLGGVMLCPDRNNRKPIQRIPVELDFSRTNDEVELEAQGAINGKGRASQTSPSPDADFTTSQESISYSQGVNRTGASLVTSTSTSGALLIEEMVKNLRQLRPSILLCPSNEPELQEKLLTAVKMASKPENFPGHLEMGLAPIQVERIVEISQSTEDHQHIAVDQFSAALGRRVKEQARFGRSLAVLKSGIRDRFNPVLNGLSNQVGWNTVYSRQSQSIRHTGITSGTQSQFDPRCNRQAEKIQIKNMQSFQSASRWGVNLKRISQIEFENPIEESGWNDAITAAIAGMDELSAGYFLTDLAESYDKVHKPLMADATLKFLLQRFPGTEFGESALDRLIQRYASVESNHMFRLILNRRDQVNHDKHRVTAASHVQNGFKNYKDIDPTGDPKVATSGHAEQLRNYRVDEVNQANAMALVNQLQTQFPDLIDRPRYAYTAALVKHRSGQPLAYRRMIDNLASQNIDGGIWRDRIERESLLMASNLNSTPVGDRCRLLDRELINLDGQFDESVWQGMNQGVRFGFDQEYLYIAIRQRRSDASLNRVASPVPSGRATQVRRKRIRDEDLTPFDRVSISLDLDRNYSSTFEITIDERGACNDGIWRDWRTYSPVFNPVWYIASRTSGNHWAAEVAIPWNSLSGKPARIGDAWIIGIRKADSGEPGGKSHPFRSSTGKSATRTTTLLFK